MSPATVISKGTLTVEYLATDSALHLDFCFQSDDAETWKLLKEFHELFSGDDDGQRDSAASDNLSRILLYLGFYDNIRRTDGHSRSAVGADALVSPSAAVFQITQNFIEWLSDLVFALRTGDHHAFILKHGLSPWSGFATSTVDEGAGGVESSAPDSGGKQ